MSFNGKVILVTGAASGIGAEVARHLIKLGGKLAISDRNESLLNKVAEELRKIDESAVLTIVADIQDSSERIINETIEHFGRLDVLVNSAGVAVLDNVTTLKIDKFQELFNINVLASIKLTQLAVPHLTKTKGNVVNVSSVLGLQPCKNVLSYSISKAALNQFTQCAALELAPFGIRVNAINPAVIKTPIYDNLGIPKDQMVEMVNQLEASYPGKWNQIRSFANDKIENSEFFSFSFCGCEVGRIGDVSDVAQGVVYLAGDSGLFLTGILLPIDGGSLISGQSIDIQSVDSN